MQSESDPNNSKASADERARLRRNQRNSRARKQEYVQDLERRWSECVKLGVQASAEIQKEGRRVHEVNKALRYIIHELGMSNDALQKRLQIILSTRNPPPCDAQLNDASPASRSTLNMAPAAMSSNENSDITIETLPAIQTGIWPFQDSTGNDSLQSWDLYSWLDDLSKLKDAYSLNAQSHDNYNDIVSPSSAFNSRSEGTEIACDPLTQRCTIPSTWVPDSGDHLKDNETVLTHFNATDYPSSQNFVLHGQSSLSEADMFDIPYYNHLGNGEYR